MPTACRVRRLRVRTPEPGVVATASARLEDALRTSSLPGFPPHGVVYLRTLDVGRVSPDAPVRALSASIDRAARRVRVVSARGMGRGEAAAEAVWFESELEPYRVLAEMVARGHRPKAWYWPVAVPGWSDGQTPEQGVALALGAAARMATGLAGMAYVAEPLLGSDLLLRAVRWAGPEAVVRWMAEAGVDVGPAPRRPDAWVGGGDAAREGEPPAWPSTRTERSLGVEGRLTGGAARRVRAAWHGAVLRAAASWGAEDVGARFVAALALEDGRRAVTEGSVRALLREVGADAPRGSEGGLSGRRREPYGRHGRSDGGVRETSPRVVSPPTGPGSGTAPARVAPDGDGAVGRPAPAPSPGGDHAVTVERSSADGGPTSGDPVSVPAGRRAVAEPAAGSGDSVEHRVAQRAPGLAGVPTDHAGLVFLVAVLERLGIRDFLGRHPEHLEADLGLRILRRVADILRIAAGDPVRAVHRDVDPTAAGPRCFVAPWAWQLILTRSEGPSIPVRLGRVTGAPGERLITGAAGRVALARWGRGARAEVDPWLERALWVGSAAARPWSHASVVDAWVLATARYVRRFASSRLARVVRRPARVSLTRTHLDVVFPLSGLDTAVRAAGLDIDPGWVPWLGRVVRFHYVGEPGDSQGRFAWDREGGA